MKIFRLTVLWAVFFGLSACGVQSTKVSNKPAPSPSYDVEDALLWTVYKGDALEGYLFGTIHLIPQEDYFFTDPMKKALQACEHLVMELDLSALDKEMANVFGLMDQLSMKDGVRLGDLLTGEDYALVEERFEELGLPLIMLERLKPAFLDMMLQVDPGELDGDYKFYEFELMHMAKIQGMTMAGLETINEQVSIFDSIPYEAQAQMLVNNLKNRSQTHDTIHKIITQYKAQRIAKMSEYFAQPDSPLAKYYALLIDNRNKNWIDELKNHFTQHTSFVAVGAGHLSGREGLINLLRKEGYTLKPVEIY